jgi:hypothetical protein
MPPATFSIAVARPCRCPVERDCLTVLAGLAPPGVVQIVEITR